jgi:hypothetical protein
MRPHLYRARHHSQARLGQRKSHGSHSSYRVFLSFYSRPSTRSEFSSFLPSPSPHSLRPDMPIELSLARENLCSPIREPISGYGGSEPQNRVGHAQPNGKRTDGRVGDSLAVREGMNETGYVGTQESPDTKISASHEERKVTKVGA